MKQYHIALPDGTRQGPYPEEYVLSMYASGQYPADTLVWTEGMPQWAPITTIAAAAAYPLPAPPVHAAVPAESRADNPAFNNPFSALWHACQHRSYTGRACRKEYWMATLGAIIIGLGWVALMILLTLPVSGAHASGGDETDFLVLATTAVLAIGLIVMLLFTILVDLPLTCRRLHDIGLSGWWQLLAYLPFVSSVGGLAVLIMTVLDSQPGVNRYGGNPKGH